MRLPRLLVAVLAFAAPLGAQRVPGRDLLDFPIGALADPPVIAAADVALWNPANIIPAAGNRGRIGFAAVQTPTDLGVSVVGFSLAAALPRDLGASVSAVRGSVAGIARTSLDPTTVPGDVAYNTTMLSAGFARRTENVTAGIAARYRTGTVDTETRGAIGVDGGLLVDSILGLPVRGAVSTFLWRPANGADEETAYSGALDTEFLHLDSTLVAGGGFALTLVEQRTSEQYLFAGVSNEHIDVRGGIARYQSAGEREWSLRVGTGLHYGRYHIGVAREGARDGLGGIYQFTLTTLIR